MPSEQEVFAKAWADPTAPTYQNALACYQIIKPDVKPDSARKAGSRYLARTDVQQIIRDFQQQSRTLAAITPDEFLARGLEILDDLHARFKEGSDKVAGPLSAQYERVGKAAGIWVTRSEDLTPPERKRVTHAELRTELEAALQQMKELDEPNPMPLLGDGEDDTEDAEFTVIEDG